MDETRPLNGLAPGVGSYPALRQSGRSENDLEDHGGDGGALERRRPRPAPPPEPPSQSTGGGGNGRDEDTTPLLVQALDRMRTTHESAVDAERIQALRGLKHYREDPQTTGFFRRRDNPDTTPATNAHLPQATKPEPCRRMKRTTIPGRIDVRFVTAQASAGYRLAHQGIAGSSTGGVRRFDDSGHWSI